MENLAPTGIRSPDRPARSQSLYRLRSPGPLSSEEQNEVVIYVLASNSIPNTGQSIWYAMNPRKPLGTICKEETDDTTQKAWGDDRLTFYSKNIFIN